MNGLKYIQAKQQNWAKRKGFELFGGTIPNEGKKNYLKTIASNIFNQQLSEETKNNFDDGDGSETILCHKAIQSSLPPGFPCSWPCAG